MKLMREDGAEATIEDVAIWLADAEDVEFSRLSAVCEELAGAFLICGQRCGLERFLNYLVCEIARLRSVQTAPDNEDRPTPWRENEAPENRDALVEAYLKATFIGSDRKHIPQALEKIGSSRVLTHEERSGYPY